MNSVDILDIFTKISNNDIYSPSIFYEWNVYRVFKSLGEYDELLPNFKMDKNDCPLHYAKAGFEDILVKYSNFDLLIECTLSTGSKQLDMEGEPVLRHLREYLKKYTKEVFTLFVAENISNEFLKYIFIFKNDLPVIPITTNQLKKIYMNKISKENLYLFLKEVSKLEIEITNWLKNIDEILNKYLSM